MDESLPSQESPTLDTSPTNHIENNEDDPAHSASPDREPVEAGKSTPPLNESNMDNRHIGSADGSADDEDRPPHRENITNGFLDAEEVMIQRHAMLNSVMVSQENESAFNCKYPGCNFTSADVELYLKHEDTHVDGGTMLCDVCNMRFATYANMRRHRLMHLGVRPFECQICSKRFIRRDQYMEHLVRHSKQRPYRCPFCSRSFIFRPHLKSHLTSDHAGIIIDKTCRLCDFKASSPNGAKIHFAMCHLKQSMDVSDDDRSQELNGSTQAHITQTENGAIDLATVSQNFSFLQTAHYSPYSASATNSSAIVPGPSDLSRTPSKVIRLSAPVAGPHALMPQSVKQNIVVAVPDDDSRHTCVSALAGSTTVVSPSTCQDRSCCRPEAQHPELPPREKICVKPEPPELTVDDSQNSNVQPTSTMDLTTTDVVETTSVNNEVPGSSETPGRRKIHKHSSGEDTGSESYHSPTNRNSYDSQSTVQTGTKTAHTCCRFRPCHEESGSQRCREYTRHTCMTHRHPQEKRPRLSESDGDRNAQNDHSDSEERKVFYSRATSTNSLFHGEVPPVRGGHNAAALQNDTVACASESRAESNYYGRKNTIVIREIESCTLTCPYCGIIFPDQTLYLLHRSLHSESSPWKCNLCGKHCKDKYDFNSHIISKGHY